MSAAPLHIRPRKRDLGGFSVARVLPHAKRRMVGPFIFFDEIGPVEFSPGDGIDVRPHPHIGLATVTYLFAGELRHRDNLGFDQLIKPGDVNWMTAGRGIVHSERTDDARRRTGQAMHGIQSWVALPHSAEQTAPEFHHHRALDLPIIEREGVRMRLIAGEAFAQKSPVKTFSEMFYLHAEVSMDCEMELPADFEERAIYIAKGAARIGGVDYAHGDLLIFAANARPSISARANSHIMMFGGAPLGERLIWWNFVASSQDLIDKAKTDWRGAQESGFQNSRFTLPPGERDHIPLPGE